LYLPLASHIAGLGVGGWLAGGREGYESMHATMHTKSEGLFRIGCPLTDPHTGPSQTR